MELFRVEKRAAFLRFCELAGDLDERLLARPAPEERGLAVLRRERAEPRVLVGGERGVGERHELGHRAAALDIDADLLAQREADHRDIARVRDIESQRIAVRRQEIGLALGAVAEAERGGWAPEVTTCQRAQRAARDGVHGTVAIEVEPRRASALIVRQRARERGDRRGRLAQRDPPDVDLPRAERERGGRLAPRRGHRRQGHGDGSTGTWAGPGTIARGFMASS